MLLRISIFTLLLTMTVFSQIPPIEPGVSQTLAKWRAANYSDVRYKLNLTLEKQAPLMKGTMTIRVTVKDAKRAPEIILDWRKVRGKENLSTVSNVKLNDKPTKFEEINEHLVFKEGVISGDNYIDLDFTSPIAASGAAVTRYVDKEDGAEYVYSLFVPSDASTAFPVFDQPDLKARFHVIVAAPLNWQVVTNSKLESQMNRDSKKLLGFEWTPPISTYVFAFAAGEFRAVPKTFPNEYQGIGGSPPNAEDLKLLREEPKGVIYVRKSQFEKFKPHIKEVFRLNREAVKYLEDYFDYKFPFPKYDLVLIPEFPFGGMEHAGATFLRESSVIFPSEPTANDYISRANLIFHEAAHQWFGDLVTMKWFDDLWLKEGFAEFMAYKTLEKVMPEYNAWKAFYERNKPLAYLTDSTKGTTPIYQEIPNLSAAKSAYGNIVYRKAPSFLKQAEFYLGEKEFQTAVQAFLKKHEFANAEWTDLVKEFEAASNQDLKDWADSWVKQKGVSVIRFKYESTTDKGAKFRFEQNDLFAGELSSKDEVHRVRRINFYLLTKIKNGKQESFRFKTPNVAASQNGVLERSVVIANLTSEPDYLFPNYQDYGYGIFLLDEKSRAYVLANIHNEKDAFLRSMMWGTLWDSVREAELAPRDYVQLAIKNISVEQDELTIQTILSRISTAMNYYLSERQRDELAPQFENLLIEKMQNAPTLGQRITFYRAFLNVASGENARNILKDVLSGKFKIQNLTLKTKDKFDIVTRLLILNDKDAPRLLAELEKTETSDEAKRYAYAAKAGIGSAENKAKYWNDFVNNKEISESWIEAAFAPFNSIRHSDATLPYLEKALAELPNLKRNRKIFFVNGWLAAFIGGQKNRQALEIVNKFLADNPSLDKDLRLKILENVDVIERAVKIREKYGAAKN
jgi:aminopeptidase N